MARACSHGADGSFVVAAGLDTGYGNGRFGVWAQLTFVMQQPRMMRVHSLGEGISSSATKRTRTPLKVTKQTKDEALPPELYPCCS